MMADKWDVPVDKQRLWMWATRQNHSLRPSSILDDKDDDIRVCDVRVRLIHPQWARTHKLCKMLVEQ